MFFCKVPGEKATTAQHSHAGLMEHNFRCEGYLVHSTSLHHVHIDFFRGIVAIMMVLVFE